MFGDLSYTRTDISMCLLHQGHDSVLLLESSSLVQETGYRYSAFYHQFLQFTMTSNVYMSLFALPERVHLSFFRELLSPDCSYPVLLLVLLHSSLRSSLPWPSS